MSTVDALVQDFLSQRRIAVVGVSNERTTGCNSNYEKFKNAGYRVYAVNPHISTYDGAPCYPDLKSIPEKPDAVFIFANPKVADDIVRQCVALGIKHVWMHCMMGTKPGLAAGITSVSRAAVETCKANGIAVIPGTCPNQFLKPDFGHGLMRRMWRMFGFLSVN
ncbi:MAG TPA: CoA-binding protein [Anaerolineales bacterium]|nr:CoA-binding protein [Anaerolineales bacterium]